MSILRSTSFFNSLGLIFSLSLSNSVWAQTPKASTQSMPLSQKVESAQQNNINKPSSSSSGKLSPQDIKSIQPSSNLLLRPNKPSEVEIKLNKPITLKQAVELGLKNNRDLQAAKLGLERAQAGLRAAQAALLPTLNTNFQFDYTHSSNSEIVNQVDFLNYQNALVTNPFVTYQPIPEDSTNLAWAIELNYSIYNGGARDANINKAQEQIKFNQLDIERQIEQTTFDVTQAYYNLQNADAQVLIAQASVEDTTRTLRDAQLLMKAGLGTQFDVLSAEVDLSTAQQSLVQAFANQKITRKQLAQVIAVAQDVELTSADEIAEAGDWKISLEESIAKAYTNRVELDQLLTQKEIYRQTAEVALAAIRPQVSLFANYSYLDNYNDSVGSGNGYAFGVKANWQIFDGGAAQATAEQSYRDMDISEVNFAKQREAIREKVEQDYFTLKANKENIGNTRKNVELASESLRLARLRFQAGVGTQTDVINSQRNLTTARSQFLQAIIGYNQSYNALQRDVSKIYTYK